MAIKDKDGRDGRHSDKTKDMIKRTSDKATSSDYEIAVRRAVLSRAEVKKTPEMFNFEKQKSEPEKFAEKILKKEKPVVKQQQPELEAETVTIKKNPPRHDLPEELRPPAATGTSKEGFLLNKKFRNKNLKQNANKAGEHKKKYRHELKYFINMRDYRVLLAAVSCALRPDEHSLNGGYHIRSLYFDDIYDRALSEKISGLNTREKYRIRIYNKSDSVIRLERKEKVGEYISKETLALSRDEYEKILANDIDFLLEKKGILAHDFYAEIRFKGLSPKVVVDYYRRAFVYPVEDVRITFDLNLRSGMFDKNIFDKDLLTMPMLEKGIAVLEVKYNKFLPSFIRGILNMAESASRSAISKYLICRKYE